MVMDRTTMTRNVAPLEREGLVEIVQAERDRRRKEVHLSQRGRERLAQARPAWRRAQAAFERHYGPSEAAAMRAMLRAVPAGAASRMPRASRKTAQRES
jgi:DNA-binding MarR family transcriptional regulator